MNFSRTASALLAISLCCLPATLSADQLIVRGGEFQANTYTTSNQGQPSIAMDAQGRAVVIWEGAGDQDGSSWGIFGQRYAVDGSPEGPEFQVNSYTVDLQVDPEVARHADGSFVVTWMSYWQTGGDDFDVFAQRFDAAGVPMSPEFQVNSYTTGYQGDPDVAIGANGDFWIVWDSTSQDGSLGGIFGQRFDSLGAPLGGEMQLNSTFASDQNDVVIAATETSFLVVWEDEGFDTSSETVVLQAFDTAGNALGGEVQVNTFTTGDQEDPDIAVATDGSFVVAWESDGQDGSLEGVFAQAFGADRLPVGAEFQVNTFTDLNQEDPQLTADGQGGFLVVWESEDQASVDSLTDVYAQRLDGQGNLVGNEIRINSTLAADQNNPVVAGARGELTVAWRAFGGQDGSQAAVIGQRLALAVFADGFESGDTGAWSTSTP